MLLWGEIKQNLEVSANAKAAPALGCEQGASSSVFTSGSRCARTPWAVQLGSVQPRGSQRTSSARRYEEQLSPGSPDLRLHQTQYVPGSFSNSSARLSL